MNRGDTRLFLTIIATATLTAVVTLLLVQPRDSRVDDQSRRIANLELRLSELEARPVTAVVEAPPAPPPPKTDPLCDEVSCVLNNYEGACCRQYVKPKPPAAADGTPDSLDRAMISDGITQVKHKVMMCGDKSSAKGQVKIHARVEPDGTPHVELKTSPDDALGACVVAAVASARFQRTVNGGSFSYPFVF
jgi:hypothetical protein